MTEHTCDFCKVKGFEEKTMNILTLTMSENYPKYNDLKGKWYGTTTWELCPICFEHITEDIKKNIKLV